MLILQAKAFSIDFFNVQLHVRCIKISTGNVSRGVLDFFMFLRFAS